METFFQKIVKGWEAIPCFPVEPLKSKRIERRFKGSDAYCLEMDWARVSQDIERAFMLIRKEALDVQQTGKAEDAKPSPANS